MEPGLGMEPGLCRPTKPGLRIPTFEDNDVSRHPQEACMANATILLVEDNPKDEALTLRALRRAGISNDVIVMRDGAAALDYLFCTGAFTDRDPPLLPTVALVDLNLPKLSGHEMVRRIRADNRTKLLPVVILTSSDEDEDRIKGYQAGANSYVRKPVEFGAFAGAVQQLGLYWLILNERLPSTTGTTLPDETRSTDLNA